MITSWSVFGVIFGVILLVISVILIAPKILSSKNIFDNMYELDPLRARKAVKLFLFGIIIIIYFVHKG